MIHPSVLSQEGVLRVTCPSKPEIGSIDVPLVQGTSAAERVSLRVCGGQRQGSAHADDVDAWFQTAVGRACRLVRQGGAGACTDGKKDKESYFSNGVSFLLVSHETMVDLAVRVSEGGV